MATYHESIKKLMEHDPVADGERVLASLEGTEFKDKWLEIVENHCRVARLLKDLKEAEEVCQAKKVLFWKEVATVCEQAESSEERGMIHGVRYDKDDKLVLVEFAPKDEESEGVPAQLAAFIRMIKKMQSGE